MIQSGAMGDTPGSRIHRPFPALLVVGTLFAVSLAACALNPLPGAFSSSTASAAAVTLPPALPSPSPQLPSTTPTADIQSQMDVLEGQVAQLRGLQPASPVHRVLLPASQVRERLVKDMSNAYSPGQAQDDATVFTLLGLLPSGSDLRQAYVDLSTDPAADFFDHQLKELVVVGDRGFGILERLAYIRAYDLAVQDQHFGLASRLKDDPGLCPPVNEGCAAVRALVEGDAALLQEQWLRTYATAQDLADLALAEQATPGPASYGVPAFVQQAGRFPQTFGLEFVRRLYLKGGWAAVDAAYASPPASTEQVLHPERYPKAAPVSIDAPDLTATLGSSWHEVSHAVLGERNIRAMLETELSAPKADEAAFGWGGDGYRLYEEASTGARVLIWIASWDGLHDAGEFATAFREYADARFGTHQSVPPAISWDNGQVYVSFEAGSDQTLWILAPDAATAGAIRLAVRFPVLHP